MKSKFQLIATAVTALYLISAADFSATAAPITYSLPEYFYPLYPGNEWVYDTTGTGSPKTVHRIENLSKTLDCYTGCNPPTLVNRTATAMYSAYCDAALNPDDSWYDYLISNGDAWGQLGYDDDPGTMEMRLNPGMVISNRMAVGQSYSFSSTVYINAQCQGTASVQVQLVATGTVTIAATTYTDCIRVRQTMNVAGEKTVNDEWWAKGIGMVKKTRAVTKPGESRTEEYALASATFVTSPRIVMHPQSATNSLTGSARFTVQAAGSDPLTYQWLKNGTNLVDQGAISGTTTTNLLITNLQLEDGGLYSVIVTNDYGSVTSRVAVLTVMELIPPSLEILSHTNLQIVANNGIVLSGTATDSGHGANGIGSVTINGVRALNDTASGADTAFWSATLKLKPNTNVLTVVAKDGRGNADTNRITIISDTVKPVLAVTAPKPGQRTTNKVVQITGKAQDTIGIAGVYYQFNANSWMSANGTANWTITESLIPGGNTFRIYAVDLAGRCSATNKMTVTYVLTAPLTVSIVGLGTVTPNYNGSLLEIGKSFTMTAKAGKGYAFQNWSGSASSTSAKLSFLMASNLSFTATFIDITRPVCIITAPKANQRWSNEVFTVTGKASDNAGVDKVWYQLNGAGWNEASFDLNHTNWTVPNIAIAAGTNVIQAFATDAAGNVSLTNTIKFLRVVVPDMAPDSLASKIVSIPDAGGTMSVCFGVSTFSQSANKTNLNWGAGSYVYTKTGTNAAELSLTFDAPPSDSGRNVDVLITFTNWTGGWFTNATDPTDYGTFGIRATATLAAASLDGKKVAVKTSQGSISIQFGATSYIQTGGDNQTGSYTYTQYSPIGGMLIMHVISPAIDAGATSYALITFSTTKSGTALSAYYDPGSSEPDVEIATFSVQ